MVSVWDAETRVSIAAARAPGGNEVAATLALLKTLVLKGCIVTADALHCHPRMAEGVLASGADYALGLKGNHGPLHAAAVSAFEQADARSPRGRYRYAGLGIPDTHHQRRRTGTTAFIGLAQGLPIHRDDAPGSVEIQTVADRTDKAGERLGEFGGVEQAEHPAETIMAGRAMGAVANRVGICLLA